MSTRYLAACLRRLKNQNPARGRKQVPLLCCDSSPQLFNNQNPARGRKQPWCPANVILVVLFNNQNPARGRKRRNAFLHCSIFSIFKNQNPARGRKPHVGGCLLDVEHHLRTRTPQGDGNSDFAQSTVVNLAFKNQNPARGRSVPLASPARAVEGAP